ncbi:MAG: hypothetical protein Q8M08_11020 [Bacteroidales bacterium]|nr:hypothetical protein [Bacteroidales bacterium]
MKTKNLFRLTFLVLAIFGLSLTGCQKEKNVNPPADSSSLQQLSNDEESVESALNESMNDVNNLLSNGNLKSTQMLPCNATIDSTVVVNDTLTIYITYNGLNCSGTRYRTGKVEIKKHVGTHWYQQGATVKVRHINFTITKVSNQKSITLNSVHVHKNVSGGVIWQLGNGMNAIVHRTWGHANVTFDDGTTKIWNVARQKTFTGTPPANLVLTIDGFGTVGDYANLLVWGLNRQGEHFYTQINQPVVHRQVCDWDPVSGIKKHAIPSDSKSATLTFGYNSNNQPITGNECPTKFRVDWQKQNNSGTVYLWL